MNPTCAFYVEDCFLFCRAQFMSLYIVVFLECSRIVIYYLFEGRKYNSYEEYYSNTYFYCFLLFITCLYFHYVFNYIKLYKNYVKFGKRRDKIHDARFSRYLSITWIAWIDIFCPLWITNSHLLKLLRIKFVSRTVAYVTRTIGRLKIDANAGKYEFW